MMRNFINILSLLALITGTTACEAEQVNKSSVISDFQGKWLVNDVLTDTSNPELHKGLADSFLKPKYLGRIVTISDNELTINTHYDEPCNSPQFDTVQLNPDALISKSISTRIHSPNQPVSADINFPLDSKQAIEVHYLKCNGELRAKDLGMTAFADRSNAIWIIRQSHDQLIMSWHDQTVLKLNKLTGSEVPKASFDCKRAGTPVEKSICSSLALAGYDKSLAKAYKQLMEFYRSAPDAESLVGELRQSQKSWIKQRNECGQDVSCLERVMSIRIDDLVYDLGDIIYRSK